MSKVIGLHGKMHTGKSALASAMRVRWPDQIAVMSFATKLRKVLQELHIPENRESLQGVGQNLRKFNSEVWVDAVKPEVQENLSLGRIVVFDDVRYPNEFEYLRNLGGLLVKLSADTEERWSRYKESTKFNSSTTKEIWLQQQVHPSETTLDKEPLDWSLDLDTTKMPKSDMGGIATALVLSVTGISTPSQRNQPNGR